MDQWKGKVVVVTGASSGIGASIACKLVEEGLQVVGFARRKERIDEMAKKLKNKPGKLCGIRVDMQKESDIVDAFKWIEKNLGCVSILINNAAVLPYGMVKDGDLCSWKSTFDTNVIGLCIATKEAITSMKKGKIQGQIIHINSVAGHKVPTTFTGLSVYPASKHAVTALTQTLRAELAAEKCNIKVASLSPGGVDTEMVGQYKEKSGMDEEVFKSLPLLKPEDVTNAILFILSTPPHVSINELMIQVVGEVM